ncbi:PREDICTED: queuine tRNA-ribosyltransferase subunit QTRTD1 homolog [Rhagoletis zephyria]|uniref:queuine tRNA-ribosyltransferase subunit QTRTD1 homolog n=1 Tax=Rhagoletis zephyria TaxID=28612 RepID=UPI0008114279|nr:PREDICTED: queuine tRNA-ribosyltransferase subunit QTRTD1 homolog [Rhagoletis zephyria]
MNFTLVPIVGGYSIFARSDSIKHAKAKGANATGGYIFEGFHNYGLSATQIDASQLITVMTHCLKELPADKPKMLPGAYTPPVILELISLGVDIFDTSYAYCATTNFKAFTFSLDITDENSAIMDPFLDITNDGLKEDFTPILASCSCLTCKKHTRAYLYHLYKTNELLGPILAMIHNLHHLIQFFNIIHTCIAEDKLPELIQHIKLQGCNNAIDYSIKPNAKTSKNDKGKGFAIIRDGL